MSLMTELLLCCSWCLKASLCHCLTVLHFFLKSCLKSPFDLGNTLQLLPPAPVGWCFLRSCTVKSADSLWTAFSSRGWESTAQRGKAPHCLSNSNVFVSFSASALDTLSHHSSTCVPLQVHAWIPPQTLKSEPCCKRKPLTTKSLLVCVWYPSVLNTS